VLAVARASSRVLITIDKDFGELAIVRQLPHAGILRLVDIPAKSQGMAANAAIERYGDELARGAIVTVEPGRVRVRPAEN
jgi:predicted nuclease of predicted toxin-antitoxin system